MGERDLTSGSRQNSCAKQNDTGLDAGLIDKWAILDELTDAAQTFGLNHRTLGVLRALISFHPARGLAPIMGAAVVFPSNRTLASRLGGMPESTLRRHIAQLVEAGLITRRDSANRKRFCRRSSVQQVAFGFDLGPLALRAGHIRSTAAEVRETQAQVQQVRAQVLSLRQHLMAHLDAAHDLIVDLTKAARRKLTLRAWSDLYDRAKTAFDQICQLTKTPGPTEEMGGSNAQNERHIEPDQRDINMNWVGAVTRAASELLAQPISSESQATKAAHQLMPMIGLNQSNFESAKNRHGASMAALTAFTLVYSFTSVPKARGLFEQVLRQANPIPLLEKVVDRVPNKENLSADNSGNYGLSGA